MKKINLTDYIQKTAADISLSETEREKMRGVIHGYMSMKPVRISPILSERRRMSLYTFSYFKKPVAFALVALLVISSGASISYAAESALPGDVLYGIKVSVNEEVRSVLTVTADERADLAMRLAEKRLAEASALVAKGRLTPEAQEELAVRFEKHAEEATQHVEKLETEDSPAAIDAASRFETEIAAHIEILEEISGDEGRRIRDVAYDKAIRVSRIREKAENDISVSTAVAVAVETPAAFVLKSAAPAESSVADMRVAQDAEQGSLAQKEAAERLKKSAGKALSEVRKHYDKASATLSEEERTSVLGAIAGAEKKMTDGDAAFQAGDFSTAFHAYQKAFVSLKKMHIFLKTVLKGSVRIRIESSPLSSASAKYNPVSPASRDSDEKKATVKVDQKSYTEGKVEVYGVPQSAIQIVPTKGEGLVDVEVEGEGSVRIESSHSGEGEVDSVIRVRLKSED